MEPAKWSALAARLAVTGVALLALVLHLSFERTKLDTTGLVLIFLALVPWLATIISRAELPGGWKLEFQEVKTEQRRQAQEIDAIKFLLAYFLTEPECRHLEGFAADKQYRVRKDGTTSFFEKELRRLRALGFIEGRPGCGVRSLLKAMADAGGNEVDARDHFEITARGRDYLRLRAEMLHGAANSGNVDQ
jgi:multisubunit Na+/H+ antiporter MnhG subunit